MQKREITQIEEKMARIDELIQDLENEISVNASIMTAQDFKQNADKQNQLKIEMEKLEDRWLELNE